MRRIRVPGMLVMAAMAAVLVSCSSSDEGGESKSEGGGDRAITTIANERIPFLGPLQEAGFSVVDARSFPAQVAGRNTIAVTYRSGDKGGVLYSDRRAGVDRMIWHWYFSDVAPDSVTALEINDDGLWDVRVHIGREVRDFLQSEAFSFGAPVRDDRVALNGATSGGDNAWHLFDGDSTSAWRGNDGAWIDLPAPLGTTDGVLTVQLSGAEQPQSCEVMADGQKVEDLELDATVNKQMFSLPSSVRDAEVVRLVFKSPRDGSGVAVSELGLK